jgi:hypothetical protein
MEILWIVSSAIVVSFVTAIVKSRRTAPRNLGYVSRDWVVRHGMEHTSV